jgi:hypothetical protein
MRAPSLFAIGLYLGLVFFSEKQGGPSKVFAPKEKSRENKEEA